MFGKSTGMSVIRLATPEDIAAVKQCAEAAYAPYVKRMGKKPAPMVADFAALIDRNSLYVLEASEELCGYIVCFGNNNHFHIENVAVSPEFHGLGYGRQLMNFAETEAKVLGFFAVELYTNEKMWENLKLYPKLGYEEFQRKSQDGFARVFFRKYL